jgi:hypothetical protein
MRSTVGSTREQNGHSKSLASTIVTGVSALFYMGSSAAIGMGEEAWLLSPPLLATSALTWTPPRSWAMPHINPIPAKKLKRKPTNAVPLFMIDLLDFVRLRPLAEHERILMDWALHTER